MILKKNNVGEYFRFVTLILVTICLFILSGLQKDVKEINEKLFKHLTNDEIHTPKSISVTKPEFQIYQVLREDQMREMRQLVVHIESMLERHMNQDKKT
jgi:hypothetical protein